MDQPDYVNLFTDFEPAFEDFDPGADLGPDFPEELAVTSALWFKTGYEQGIAAYLNFFLLTDFIVTHDEAYPPRFASFRSMANSFYRTDLFVRDVTDSGLTPTGGISSRTVRDSLKQTMRMHARISIPPWMMTYFGFQLLEAVEQQCAPVSEEDKQRHLAYMSKAFRIMGIPFTDRREPIEQFARSIEAKHAGPSPNLEKHARNILILGEMVGVSSDPADVSALLPTATRKVFATIQDRVRPGFLRRNFSRLAGRLLVKRAVGTPRKAVPVEA